MFFSHRWPGTFFWLVICSLIFSSPLLAKRSQPIVSRITLRTTDIFDLETKPYLRKFPYTWINFLHIQTKEQIIRQELLFKVGEPVDDFLLRETERNLRALPFVRSARVARFPQRDGTVALVVYAADSWTTEPQVNLAGLNKIDDLEIGFKEKNLLGYGKSFEVSYQDDEGQIRTTYKFVDRRLFDSRWQLSGDVSQRSDGNEQSVSLSHPFFSADTPMSGGASFRRNVEDIDEVVKNVKVSEFDQTKETYQVFGSIKVGGGRRWVNHAGLRYRNINQRFSRNSASTPSRAIPQSEEFQTIFLDYDTTRNKFVELTRIEKMTRIEDINLGPVLRVSPGYSPTELTGSMDSTELETSYEQKTLIKGEHLLSGRLSHASRATFENSENERFSAMGKYYHRYKPRQTVVVHSRLEWGNDLDSDNQIKLGNDNGLRAFKSDAFTGSRSWLLNIEDRIFMIDELWDLVSIGSVVFYDVGYAWSPSRTLDLSRARGDIGAGLRFGMTRSSNEVIIRIDVAYRLHRLSPDDPKFVLTFGSGHAF